MRRGMTPVGRFVTGLLLGLMSSDGYQGLRTPSALTAKLKEMATRGMVGGIAEGSPNLIANNGNGSS